MKRLAFLLSIVLLSKISVAQIASSKTRATKLFKTLNSAPEPRQAVVIKKDFPFDIPLKDTAGRVYSSANLLQTDGKPLVLLFWLTTCGPCRMELTAIKQHFEAWQKETDFRLLAISTDWLDNADKFVTRTKQEAWQFEAYHDYNREFMEVMPGGLNGLPQVFVFDKKGQIQYHHRRFIPGDELALYAKVKEIAAQK
jgi:peroxiredoxin